MGGSEHFPTHPFPGMSMRAVHITMPSEDTSHSITVMILLLNMLTGKRSAGRKCTQIHRYSFSPLPATPWMASIPTLSHSAGPPALTPVLLAIAAVNLVGTLVFAIAILRARVFPRWPAIVLIVCILLNFVGNPLGFDQLSAMALAVLHLAIAWFGYILCFRSTDVQEAVPSPLQASNTGIKRGCFR